MNTRTPVEVRADELFAAMNPRCSCGHPADTGSRDHAPDCAWVQAADEAWERADEEAEEVKAWANTYYLASQDGRALSGARYATEDDAYYACAAIYGPEAWNDTVLLCEEQAGEVKL